MGEQRPLRQLDHGALLVLVEVDDHPVGDGVHLAGALVVGALARLQLGAQTLAALLLLHLLVDLVDVGGVLGALAAALPLLQLTAADQLLDVLLLAVGALLRRARTRREQ